LSWLKSPRNVFVVLCLAAGLTLPILSFDYGITEDEQLHNHHGNSILDYFLGLSDSATRHPIDDHGKLEFVYDSEARDLSGALNIYGGLFDLLCAVSYRTFSPLGEYENRHLLNSLFGVLLIVFTGLTAAELAGWRAGVLALLLIGLSPRIVGHSMNNPVDVPFAALYILTVFFIVRFVRELPRPSIASWLPMLLGIALATDVRIAGLVLICYLLLFVWLWCLPRLRREPGAVGRALGIALLLSAGGYLLAAVLWPLAHRNPLTTPLLAVTHLSRLETFNALDLFEGRWINDWEVPWYFVPKWMVIGTPLFIPLGLLLSPILIAACRRNRTAGDRKLDCGKVLAIAFTFLFPLLFVVLRDSNVYNDARHILFAYPPLVVLCAVIFESVLRSTAKRVPQVVFGLLLAGTLVEPLHFMVRNHPNAGVYFSPLIGGVNGAWGRYETDFWGNSVRQAVEWIQANAEPLPGRPVRIRLWYGDQAKAKIFIEKRPGFEHVIAPADTTEWDYQILQTVECKYFPRVLQEWPPLGTVYEVLADDAPLTAVVINHRVKRQDEVLRRMTAWAAERPRHATYFTLSSMLEHYGRSDEALQAFKDAVRLPPHPVGRSHDEYLSRSVKLFAEGHYEESVMASRLALLQRPDSARAHYNICTAQIELQQWTQAKRACEQALELDPSHERARNNLSFVRMALQGKEGI